ncbi:dna polymerase subunit delta-4 [Pyrrhoderma noxium]|uniref:Dna polymerase subunit delta-4 n=1 Tax=Pyrrhoderma noxium TaxID=2282107 RepID=A0A286UJY2_9AGAM|nr:dna polymerase subunit delta-4 [Pyrrhoderma noxium]
MAPTSKPKTLKQGTLSFTSVKRGAPATASGKANLKPKAIAPAISTIKLPNEESRRPISTRSISNSSTISISTSEDDDDVIPLPSSEAPLKSVKRLKTSNGYTRPSLKPKAPANDSSSEEEPDILRDDLNVIEKTKGVSKLYSNARFLMGEMPPIHAEEQSKIHHILRIFDTSYEYGPCVGMTRLERWERAHAFGLNPPPEVRQILMTEQAYKNDEYKQSIFYGDV